VTDGRPTGPTRGAIGRWARLISGALRSAFNDPDAWEASIRAFERSDRLRPPPAGRIAFVGSSTFTLWTTLEQDMKPLEVINRGFGGAKLADVTRYCDRLIGPCRPRAVILFAGTNDLAGRRPATAQQVLQGYLDFVAGVRRGFPDTPIYYLAITPTPLRFRHWPIAREANGLVADHARRHEHLHYVDATSSFFGSDGRPDRRLFRLDGLHPNGRGYALLSVAIKQAVRASEPRRL
jgi:lysophospholipase L1-like esterase